MTIKRFRDWKIQTKLIAVTLFLVLFPLVSVAAIATSRVSQAMRAASEQDLAHIVENIYAMCKIQQEMETLNEKLLSDLILARDRLQPHGAETRLVPGQMMRFKSLDQPGSEESHTVVLPAWWNGETLLSRDTGFVDSIQGFAGDDCSLYQKTESGDLLNISTTIKGKDGSRLIGSIIPSGSEAAKSVLAGKTTEARILLAGEWYIGIFSPVLESNGSVAGAIAVSVKEQMIHSFREEIKRIQVGDTGYSYIIDSKGDLKVHPAKEGENILHAEDSKGFEYIRALIADAVKLKEGEVGTSRYSWLNPELGETRPRQKIVKFAYFKPWDWIVAAGSYENEIYKAPKEIDRFIAMVVFLSVGLVFVLIIAFSKLLTGPIRELTEVTMRVSERDLPQRIVVRTGDEIGLLGNSFNRMIEMIRNYTSNLEQIVGTRTQQLRISEKKYRDLSLFLNSVLDSATAYGIIAIDCDGKIIEFNRGAENLFGWKKEEVLNKESIRITLPPEDLENSVQNHVYGRTRTNGVSEMELMRLKKDGDCFPAHSTITAIKDPTGTATGFVEVLHDLTIRRSLERELRETKEFLENIMESCVDGIVTTDLKGKVTYMNRSMERIVSWERKNALGKHVSRIYVGGIDEARKIMKLLLQNARTENYAMEIKATTGQIKTILNTIFLVRNEAGQNIGTAGLFKDITHQKKLEDDLKEAQANLVETSKMRALGELVAGVAHEVNNPLMASQTILHVLMKNLRGDNENLNRLELIRKCNNRIERIVDHLKEFSRQTKPEFQPIDINQPVENALLITAQQLLDHGIFITRKLDPNLPKIIGDSNQIEQVFLNLFSNAKDAMDMKEGGSKELKISSYQTEEQGEPCVVVSVEDSGIGVPEENLTKILEPFFTSKPVGKGTGLGLSLCFGIVEAHGGRLEFKSEYGNGTEVKVIIPSRPIEE